VSEQEFGAILISGLVLGSLYALMAAGLSLIWSTLKVFNFAHGALVALGAYAGWVVSDQLGVGFALTLILGVLIMAALSLPFGAIFVRPFITRPNGDLIVVVTTIAAATVIQNAVTLIWGTDLKRVPEPHLSSLHVLGNAVGPAQIVAIVAAPVLLIGVGLLLKFSNLGLAIRGVEQNRDFSQLLGVRPPLIYAVTIAIAVALAGFAGILLGSIRFVTPEMGTEPLLKAFVVVVFGGLTSLTGTAVSAYVIGLLEAVSTYYLGLYWSPVVIFGVLVVVMMIRPEGLITRREVTV
jgi:branched-chain amino acid transport system permease protein